MLWGQRHYLYSPHKNHHCKLEKKDLVTLIKRVLSGASTKEDEDLLDNHFNESFHAQGWNEEKWGNKKDLEFRIKTKIKAHVSGAEQIGEKSVLRKYLPYAAAILFFLLMGDVVWNTLNNSWPIEMDLIANEEFLEPGEDRALLELSGGEVIDLENLTVGELCVREGFSVRKTEDGVVEYVHSTVGKPQGAEVQWNTLRTPLGGRYHIVLADGTKVWMNAGSSLTFPEQFVGNQRLVKAVGEMYFEVSHNKDRPFIVSSNGTDIRVLGTAFNLSAYQEMSHHSVSLVEGAVELITDNKSVKLSPGEKGVVNRGTIDISPFDIESELAWKNDYFIFKNQNIKKIMKTLSRWYDADVLYVGEDWENLNFTIRISRRKDIQEILSLIELTQSVNFQIEGRRIIVNK